MQKSNYFNLVWCTVIFSLVIVSIFLGKVFWQEKLSTSKSTEISNGPLAQDQIISGLFDQSSFKTAAQWKEILTPQQFYILREAGTERPFSGELNHEKRSGTYYSFGCDKPLFRSEQKYDSGTGWPSFWAPISPDAVVLRQDPDGERIEVLDTCGGHLGHVFDDGPAPTGQRYCMNSLALKFVPDN